MLDVKQIEFKKIKDNVAIGDIWSTECSYKIEALSQLGEELLFEVYVDFDIEWEDVHEGYVKVNSVTMFHPSHTSNVPRYLELSEDDVDFDLLSEIIFDRIDWSEAEADRQASMIDYYYDNYKDDILMELIFFP